MSQYYKNALTVGRLIDFLEMVEDKESISYFFR